MQIVNVVDGAQAQAPVQQRIVVPPATAPPRRVQAINRQAGPDDRSGVGTSPPEDGTSLALSPESREAARQAMIEELRASQTRSKKATTGDTGEPAPEVQADRARQEQAVQELQQRDRDVRAHEHAQAAAAGSLASSPTFTYQVGPDGRLYAVSGDVKIDTTPVAGDPAATLRKAQQIEQAAFAPGDPSPEDRRAAVMASVMASRARQELARQKEEASHGEAGPPAHRVSQIG
jgi:hypothetical protein